MRPLVDGVENAPPSPRRPDRSIVRGPDRGECRAATARGGECQAGWIKLRLFGGNFARVPLVDCTRRCCLRRESGLLGGTSFVRFRSNNSAVFSTRFRRKLEAI